MLLSVHEKYCDCNVVFVISFGFRDLQYLEAVKLFFNSAYVTYTKMVHFNWFRNKSYKANKEVQNINLQNPGLPPQN